MRYLINDLLLWDINHLKCVHAELCRLVSSEGDTWPKHWVDPPTQEKMLLRLWTPAKSASQGLPEILSGLMHLYYTRVLKNIQRQDTTEQVSCILECRINKTLAKKTDVDGCLPWYYPPVNQDTRLCAPFEAQEFEQMIQLVSVNECRVWLIFMLRC